MFSRVFALPEWLPLKRLLAAGSYMAIGSNKRLLLELDKHRSDVNRKTINSCIEDLNLEKLKPIVEMVAKSRAAYLCELMKVSANQADTGPSAEQIEQLRTRRLEFSELVDATNALEVVIERGYLDIIEAESN
jgi:hypothetical protein